MSDQTPVGILLAAGYGRRFDPSGVSNKLLQPLENGTPVAVQSAQNLLGTISNLIAVVRCPDMAALLHSVGCTPLLFTDAEQGMGATLAFAVRYIVQQFPETKSLLVALADMPFIQTATINRIVSELNNGAQIVQPIFKKHAGHPVGFSSAHFPALAALQGDTGARHLLREFSVTGVEVDDQGCVLDIDYQTDLQKSD